MNIAMLNFEYPPLGGGAGRATRALARELGDLGHQAVVLTTRFGDQPAREEREGHLLLRIRAPRRREATTNPAEMLGFMFSALWRVEALLRPLRPEVVLSFFGIPCGPVGWWLGRRLGIPNVVMLRGGDIPGFLPDQLALYHRLTNPLTRFIWHRAALVVANSQGARDLALATGWGVPIEVIPNGVDTEFFRPAPRVPGEGPLKIIFVGRLNPQKALDLLLQALASPLVLASGQDWRLLLVGDGPLRGQLQSQARKLRLEGQIQFLGWQTSERLLNLYQSSDIFVLPSWDEGMPNTLLEAMACGLPSIVTRISGSQELVRAGVEGLLVDRGDTSGLASALTDLLVDASLRRRMGEHARRSAEQRSWRSITIDLVDMLAGQVLGKRDA